jgi:glucosyl-dolichyl phosphate glucuronosyltransferase
MFKLSVIIPTYNRVESLRCTINSFIDQTYDKNLYEIIVSNNNSTDETDKLLRWYAKEYPTRFKYIKELRQGSHYARNSAAKLAKGELLYFTDDDMIADPDLLNEITQVFKFDPKVASVTGRVLPKWEVQPPDWVLELCYNELLSLNNPAEEFIISTQDCNIYSCHQAVLKEVFFKAGGFNPDIIGDTWVGDNETGLNIKIKELGYKFGYSGKSITYHWIPLTRMTQSYLNKRLSNQGNCDSYTAYRQYHYSNLGLYKQILHHGFRILVSGLKAIINILRGQSQWRRHHANIFYGLNRIKYDYRLITDQYWKTLVLKQDWLNDSNYEMTTQ